MNSASLFASANFNHALETATHHFHFDKILPQLGFGASGVDYHRLFSHLIDFGLQNITFVNMLALTGAIFSVATLLVRTIVPLRFIAIVSNVFFIAYGALAGSAETFILYLLSLPINIFRLRQMIGLVKKARGSAQGDLSMDWLRPFMSPRKYRKGQVLFRKGDVAKEMCLTVTGRFLVTELGIELPPGRILGELGFVAPNNRRTQTVECTEDGEVLTITYEKLLELYFQNPEFGYYFLRLATERLMQNIARLEGIIETNQQDILRLHGIIEASKATAR